MEYIHCIIPSHSRISTARQNCVCVVCVVCAVCVLCVCSVCSVCEFLCVLCVWAALSESPMALVDFFSFSISGTVFFARALFKMEKLFIKRRAVDALP